MPDNVFQVYNDTPIRTCVIFDSPHSGTHLPEDFKFDCSTQSLYECADLGVAEVLEDAKNSGVTCLLSRISRTYIDLNRPPLYQDLRAEWRNVLDLSGSSKRLLGQLGTGLVWLRTREPDIELIYKSERSIPSKTDIKYRLQNYYVNYHKYLSKLICDNIQEFGCSYHVSWHCCLPSRKNYERADVRPDFIVSNCFGATSSMQLVSYCRNIIRDFGFKVAVNDELTGGYIIQRHSSLDDYAQSIQIEVVKDLYMTYPDNEFHSGLEKIQKAAQAIGIEISSLSSRNFS